MRIYLRFILANLTRRKLRTFVTGSGVAIACAAMFSLVSFQRGYQSGLKGELDKLGAHVLVVPKGCPYDAASIALHGASWPCYLKSDYLGTVRQTAHVAVAAPVYMAAVYRQDTGAQVVYCGVEPDIVQLKRTWKINGKFPSAKGEILAGSDIATDSGWKVGSEVKLPGVENVNARVSGILASTQGADDLFVFMPLADAQEVFHRPGQLTHILVRLDEPQNMDLVVSALRGCDAGLDMNVVPLAHLFRTIQNLVESTRLLLVSAALVGLIVAGAGVSNTVLMAIVERTREIGVLRAVGASRRQVFGFIWAETVGLCLAGGFAGILFATFGSKIVESWLRSRLPFTPHDALISPEWGVALLCLAAAAVLGTVAGLLPAWRAARLSPVVAIRSGGGA